jgi:hypothetical protein
MAWEHERDARAYISFIGGEPSSASHDPTGRITLNGPHHQNGRYNIFS